MTSKALKLSIEKREKKTAIGGRVLVFLISTVVARVYESVRFRFNPRSILIDRGGGTCHTYEYIHFGVIVDTEETTGWEGMLALFGNCYQNKYQNVIGVVNTIILVRLSFGVMLVLNGL